MPDSDQETCDTEHELVAEAQLSADLGMVSTWLLKHAAAEFVAVPNKTVTKKSKFEEEKPGWVFKLGEAGLGYYRDREGRGVTVSLAEAIRPTSDTPAASLSLDELVDKPV